MEPQAFRHQSPRRLCRGLSPPTEQVCGAQPREGRSARRPTRGAGPTAPAARPGPAAGSGSGSEMSARRATSAGGRSSLHRTRTAGSPRLGPPRSRGVGRGLGALLTSSATAGSRSAKQGGRFANRPRIGEVAELEIEVGLHPRSARRVPTCLRAGSPRARTCTRGRRRGPASCRAECSEGSWRQLVERRCGAAPRRPAYAADEAV